MVTIVSSKAFMTMHKPWYEHPENPGRIATVVNAVEKVGYDVQWEEYVRDQDEGLKIAEKIHVRGYIDYLKRTKNKTPCELDPDTYFVDDTLELALFALNLSYEASIRARRSNDIYLVLLRPPGHHAGRAGKAMGAPTQGFCILNNAAAATISFLEQGYRRIAVLDVDVHCGNGTEEIFYERNDVLNIDIHRDPADFYPFTCFPEQIGKGRGEGYAVNLLLPPRAGDDIFLKFIEIVETIATSYNPEALVVSLGLDGYLGDGLSDTRLTSASYHSVGSLIKKLGLPTVILLEGGYSRGLEYGVDAFLDGISDRRIRFKRKTTTHVLLLKEYLGTARDTIRRIGCLEK